MTTEELAAVLQAAGEDRRNAIRECVTWLARHCHYYKPEYLAGEMARNMLGDDA